MSAFENSYSKLMDKLKTHLTDITAVINEMYQLQDDAKKHVVNEETTINDLLHFLEFESAKISDRVKIRTADLLSDCRKNRRHAKSLLVNVSNFNKVAPITIGDFNSNCLTLLNEFEKFITIENKPLEFNAKNVDFDKLKKGSTNVFNC